MTGSWVFTVSDVEGSVMPESISSPRFPPHGHPKQGTSVQSVTNSSEVATYHSGQPPVYNDITTSQLNTQTNLGPSFTPYTTQHIPPRSRFTSDPKAHVTQTVSQFRVNIPPHRHDASLVPTCGHSVWPHVIDPACQIFLRHGTAHPGTALSRYSPSKFSNASASDIFVSGRALSMQLINPHPRLCQVWFCMTMSNRIAAPMPPGNATKTQCERTGLTLI